MNVRNASICCACFALIVNCGLKLPAQAPVAPTAYTVTLINSMFGPGEWMKTSRSGSKVLVEQTSADKATDPTAAHSMTLYDLDRHTSVSWSTGNATGGCATGTFSGDWGDPFASASDMTGGNAKQVGTETVREIAANVLEVSAGAAGTAKAWIDPKTGLLLKAQMTPPGGAPKTIVEVLDASWSAPPPSIFAAPPACAAAAAAPPPTTEDQKIAEFTGDEARNYVKAIYGPGSTDACTVMYRVVNAGTMEPITSGFQVAVDLNVASEPAPSYKIGIDAQGHSTFSGGGLHEIVSETQDGVYRIEHAPAQFNLETAFGNAGDTQSLVYLKCYAPETVLLLIVKNPASITDGTELLWAKSGKYANVPQ
jgi:hypothetical protein